MKNKKGLIALSSVVVVCALGLIVSPLMNWSVDTDSTSGNIGKSSRFSRKTTTESVSNMEELIMNDPSYKNGIVTAYMVMQTRAQEFGALVDMSNEVAGDIPEFEGVLDEMNKVAVTVSNVCASLVRAGENINATLNGEKRPDLAQNTINASLAYTTLQKQNKLANKFIDVTDKYLENAEGTDRLKFVRDQWVDYQMMTAALEGDTESAEALQKKGALLSAEKTVSALGSFNDIEQVTVISHAIIAHDMGVANIAATAIPEEVVGDFINLMGQAIRNAGGVEVEVSDALRNGIICQTNEGVEFVKSMGWNELGDADKSVTNLQNEGGVGYLQNEGAVGYLQNEGAVGYLQDAIVMMGRSYTLTNSFEDMVASIKNSEEIGVVKNAVFCNQVNDAIDALVVGDHARVSFQNGVE